MKILLDECVTKHLKPYLAGHEVWTVREMDWSGIKNGKLMFFCVDNHFDILLTIDKNLKYQQNIIKYPITLVELNSFRSAIEELITFLPSFFEQLSGFDKHKVYLIEK